MNLSSSRAMSRVIGEESGKREREWRRVGNEQEGQFLRTKRRRGGREVLNEDFGGQRD